MGNQCRPTRNIENSIFQFLEEKVANDWSNIDVIIGFDKAYDIEMGQGNAIISVRLENTLYTRVGVGTKSYSREPLLLIDLFCSSDSQREDLKDYVIDIFLKETVYYYQYEMIDGHAEKQYQIGILDFENDGDKKSSPDTEKQNLDVHDRYRHLLTFTVDTGEVE